MKLNNYVLASLANEVYKPIQIIDVKKCLISLSLLGSSCSTADKNGFFSFAVKA